MKSREEKIKACLSMVRRISPKNPDDNIEAMLKLDPNLEFELLQRIDVPLSIGKDPNGLSFIKCEYNRDGDSYRSPWDNKFYPPVNGTNFYPSEKLRELEISMNDILQTYKDFYYGDGSTVCAYFWNLEESSFACAVVTKNIVESEKIGFYSKDEIVDEKGKGKAIENDFSTSGIWNSINVVSVDNIAEDTWTYRCFNTCYIEMDTSLNFNQENDKTNKENDKNINFVEVNGYHTIELNRKLVVEKKHEKDLHIKNIGEIIEEAEIETRKRSLDIFIHRMQGSTMEVLEKKIGSENKAAVENFNKRIEELGRKKDY